MNYKGMEFQILESKKAASNCRCVVG